MRRKAGKILVFSLKLGIAVFSFVYIWFNLSKYGSHQIKLNIDNTYEGFLVLSVCLLMILNWTIESVKWRFLMRKLEKISLFQSLKAVFTGIAFAIFTPNRIGELAGRIFVLQQDHRVKGIFSTGVGSLAQMTVTVVCGLIGGILMLIVYPSKLTFIHSDHVFWIAILSGLAALLFPLLFFNLKTVFRLFQKFRLPAKAMNTLHVISEYTKRELLLVFLMSLSRYFVFVLQFCLLLVFFNAGIHWYDAVLAISLTYFVSSIVPSFTLAEIGIRGSAAIFFMGLFITNDLAVLSATVLLWIVNLAIPSVIGAILFFRTKV